ncbi:family 43 glycosylhydrolase [Flavobacterium sp. 3HN19-14]|uniref:family 43 glycosylhydrolase n=1 Tax=Flavobacterium sp. 3HN19-14 TaxID=3448133 RepID=UPI003EE1AA11
MFDYIRGGSNDWNSYYKFNGIDPSYIVTETGEHYLVYGSWMTGIAQIQLNPETGKPNQLNTIADYGTRIAGRGNTSTNRWQGLEGAEIIYNPDTQYYYLFMAYDELSVAYNTRVARSTNINGHFLGNRRTKCFRRSRMLANADTSLRFRHTHRLGRHFALHSF